MVEPANTDRSTMALALAEQWPALAARLQPAAATEPDVTLETDLGRFIVALLEARLSQIARTGKALADDYASRQITATAGRPPRERGYVLVRCRLRDGGLRIEWFRQRHTRTVDPATGRRRVFSQHLPKGRGYRYPDSAFRRHARDWELPLIQEYEDRFAELRRQAAALTQLRRQVRCRLLNPARTGLRQPAAEERADA